MNSAEIIQLAKDIEEAIKCGQLKIIAHNEEDDEMTCEAKFEDSPVVADLSHNKIEVHIWACP